MYQFLEIHIRSQTLELYPDFCQWLLWMVLIWTWVQMPLMHCILGPMGSILQSSQYLILTLTFNNSGHLRNTYICLFKEKHHQQYRSILESFQPVVAASSIILDLPNQDSMSRILYSWRCFALLHYLVPYDIHCSRGLAQMNNHKATYPFWSQCKHGHLKSLSAFLNVILQKSEYFAGTHHLSDGLRCYS